MIKNLRKVLVVSVSTMASRVLGLLRDMLVFAFLGIGVLNSAFTFAFTLPNLFRRLLGEGALSSALIPVLSHEIEKEGKKEAYQFLNQVFTWTLLALVLLVSLSMGGLYALKLWPGLEERWYLGAEYGVILMPYMIFVCLAAVLAASLNVMGKFALSSLSQVWLNLAIIIALGGVGYFFAKDTSEIIYYLCGGVLIGGFFQVIIPIIGLMRRGWRPSFDFTISAGMRELFSLMLPGLASAAVFQVNIMVSRLLAFSLNNEAVSVLYLANRLIELPMGIFTIAVITVVFPSISQLAARKDHKGFGEEYVKGVRLVLSISIPAMFGLIILSEPILTTLFAWGRFDTADVSMTVPIVMIFAMGLPFYSIAALATRGFHALKDMKTPFRVAMMVFVLNFGLSLLFMRSWGMAGLAIANLVVAVLQGGYLHILLKRKLGEGLMPAFGSSIMKMFMASIVMGLFVELLLDTFLDAFGWGKVAFGFSIGVGIPAGITLYFVLLKILRVEEWALFKNFILRADKDGLKKSQA